MTGVHGRCSWQLLMEGVSAGVNGRCYWQVIVAGVHGRC